MFSGIVEHQAQILSVNTSPAGAEGSVVTIDISRPADFTDIAIGDSICVSGVCLTVEEFAKDLMTFAVGFETQKVTGWSVDSLRGRFVNLERSLKFGARIHGHMVSGHVDATAHVAKVQDVGGSVIFDVEIPKILKAFVWKKGSWAVNGVSLTINSVENGIVSHCLIPETLKRTNLGNMKVGDTVNLEVDMMARGIVSVVQELRAQKPEAMTKEFEL